MEGTFTKKTDEKKEAQAPPAALPDQSLSLQGELGAPAGMPLFLQASPLHSTGSRSVQAKLIVNEPGDAFEQEADRMAEQVVSSAHGSVRGRQTGSVVQRRCAGCESGAPCKECEEEEEDHASVQRKVESDAMPPGRQVSKSYPSDIRPGGRPLDTTTRAFFEPRFDHNFSRVRVHDDARAGESARGINALAYTTGEDIVFAPGRYTPDTMQGRRLLAHELTHVVQQTGDRGLTGQPPIEHAGAGATLSAPPASIQRTPGDPADAGVSDTATVDAGPPADAAAPQKDKPPAGDNVITVKGVQLSADQAFDRAQLEEYITQYGQKGADALLDELKSKIGEVSADKSDYNGVTPEYEALVQRESKMLEVQRAVEPALAALKDENAKFLQEFEMRSRIVLTAMLNLSEERVLKEQAHYGLKTTTYEPIVADEYVYTPPPSYSMEEGPAKKALSAAAKDLAPRLRLIADKRMELAKYETVDNPYAPSRNVVTDQVQWDRVNQELQDAKFAYLTLRNEKLGEFPILASFAVGNADLGAYDLRDSANRLDKIAAGSIGDVAESLNKEANDKLEKIAEVRNDLNAGDLSIWKLDTIVAGTKEALKVEPGSMHGKVVDEKVAQVHSDESIVKIAIGVIALALGLLAAIPTGGSSLVAAVTVTAAVGSAALSVTVAVSDLKEYSLKSALSGTDFDKARAISQDEPSMFWLALSIVGAAIDVGAAVGAFKALSIVAREAREAKRIAALSKAEADMAAAEQKVKQLIEAGDAVKPGLGKRLEANVGHVAGEEAKNVESIAAKWEEGLTSETKAVLSAPENREILALYKEMDPGIRDLLTHCASVCIIPNITRRDYARIKEVVYKYDVEDLGGLKQFFHYRRNDLGKALGELEAAKSAEDIRSLIKGTLLSSTGEAELEAVRTFERLEQAGVKDVSKEQFIERYRAGLRYDEATHTWYSPVAGIGEKARIPLSATSSEALTSLTASEGFGPYRDVLLREKIISGDEELVQALEKLKPQGRPVDVVRHELKEIYQERLLQRLTKPDEAAMRLRYPELPWDKPEEAIRQASYQEMRRITDGLASSDKGNIFERWYREVFAPGATEHVSVKAEDLKKLGSEFDVNRFPDLVQGDKIRELKRVAGPLGARDLEQFEDNMRMLGKLDVTVGGQTQRLKQAIYTFPIPEGVKANVAWMRRQLATYPGTLSFEVFNGAGETRLITKASDLSKAEFWTWLGLPQ